MLVDMSFINLLHMLVDMSFITFCLKKKKKHATFTYRFRSDLTVESIREGEG